MFCGLEILKNDQRPIIDLNTEAGGCFGGCWHSVGTLLALFFVGTVLALRKQIGTVLALEN